MNGAQPASILVVDDDPGVLDVVAFTLRREGFDGPAERVTGEPAYGVLDYCDRMDLAYAAADLAFCRAGMTTVAEAVPPWPSLMV